MRFQAMARYQKVTAICEDVKHFIILKKRKHRTLSL